MFQREPCGFQSRTGQGVAEGKFPEVVGGTDFWSDKQIKNKYSALK